MDAVYKSAKKRIIAIYFFFLCISVLLVNVPSLSLNDSFYQGKIDEKENWTMSQQQIDLKHSLHRNLFLSFGNTTLGMGIYLSSNVTIDAPLNASGFIEKQFNKNNTRLALTMQSESGTVAISLNGSIIVAFNDTLIPFYIEEESKQATYSEFETFVGENVSVPINVKATKYTTELGKLPEIETTEDMSDELILIIDAINVLRALNQDQNLSIIIEPEVYLVGTISLSAQIQNQMLNWTRGDELYIKNIQIPKGLDTYQLEIANISYDISNTTILTRSANVSIEIADTQVVNPIYIDFSTVQSTNTTDEQNDIIVMVLEEVLRVDQTIFELEVIRQNPPIGTIILVTAIVITAIGAGIYKELKKQAKIPT